MSKILFEELSQSSKNQAHQNERVMQENRLSIVKSKSTKQYQWPKLNSVKRCSTSFLNGWLYNWAPREQFNRLSESSLVQ
ncbi:hypothetical protein CRN80_14730 [Pseudomonas sp. FDAARGOS_380]|nr:hypothetical protein CRN80_14730 [Pseudomonas sp. FDAARGOS_380]